MMGDGEPRRWLWFKICSLNVSISLFECGDDDDLIDKSISVAGITSSCSWKSFVSLPMPLLLLILLLLLLPSSTFVGGDFRFDDIICCFAQTRRRKKNRERKEWINISLWSAAIEIDIDIVFLLSIEPGVLADLCDSRKSLLCNRLIHYNGAAGSGVFLFSFCFFFFVLFCEWTTNVRL